MQGQADFHFTYKSGASDLEQGDVLAKTEAVRRLLDKVHPHYAKDDYTHLLVLTQSCDLVRRKGRCKARYISIAAVRPLSLLIEREIQKHQLSPLEREAGVCSTGPRLETKLEVERLVERLLNNNEPEFFYLEPELALGLSEPCCAFLRLSIAVRANDHYETLLGARLLSLTDVFQAKLGWLIGNMYSRVGTPDWVPECASPPEFKAKVDQLVGAAVPWVSDEQLSLASATRPPGSLTREELRRHIAGTVVPARKDVALDAVMRVVTKMLFDQREILQQLRGRLSNDPRLRAIFREAAMIDAVLEVTRRALLDRETIGGRLLEELYAHPSLSEYEEGPVLGAIFGCLREVLLTDHDTVAKRLRTRLGNDPTISSALKD